MKNLSATQYICLTVIILQFFVYTESLPAQNIISVNDKKTDNNSVKNPKIFFQNPDFNFGKVYKGDKVEHVFTVENRGNSTLEIKKVKPSCGCTAVILSHNTIPPGNKGEIKATFNSRNYTGKVQKTIAVLSNDPDTPSHKLTIVGEIIEEITVTPRYINFGSIRMDDKSDKTVTVSVKSETYPDFKIKKISSSKPFVEAAMKEEQNGEYKVVAGLKKDYRETGRFSGNLFLDTNDVRQPKISIVFYGVIEGDITINQKRVYFGTVPEGRETTRKIFIKINESKVKILKTEVSPDFLSVHVDERYDQRNPHCLIEIKLHGDAPVGKINGMLNLYTNSEKMPLIKMPITGEVHRVHVAQ